MNPGHLRILTDMLALPTAPFVERHVAGYVQEFCRRRTGLRCRQDPAGNLWIELGRPRRPRLVLAAHMDHPGFVAEEMAGRRTVRARWRGSVPPSYFKAARVRFFSEGRWVAGVIRRIRTEPTGNPRSPERVTDVAVAVPRPVEPGSVGMWDLGPVQIRGDRLYAVPCDDVAGAASTLACLDELVRRGRPAALAVLLTRAEEAGFGGAIAACRHGTIPPDALVIAIECSSRSAGARLGDGPVLRVGDWVTTFTPAATAWCRAVADRMAAQDRSFVYQRKLMDGGTCESAVYCEFGYTATGLCIPLGNYHNVERSRGRLAREYIDLRDWARMVRWFVALATTDIPYEGRIPGFRERLRELEKEHRSNLRRYSVFPETVHAARAALSSFAAGCVR